MCIYVYMYIYVIHVQLYTHTYVYVMGWLCYTLETILWINYTSIKNNYFLNMGKYWLVYSQDTVMSMAWFLSLAWFVSKFYVEWTLLPWAERSGLKTRLALTWKAWGRWSHPHPIPRLRLQTEKQEENWLGKSSQLSSRAAAACAQSKQSFWPRFWPPWKRRSWPIHVWSMGQDQGQWPVLVYGPVKSEAQWHSWSTVRTVWTLRLPWTPRSPGVSLL